MGERDLARDVEAQPEAARGRPVAPRLTRPAEGVEEHRAEVRRDRAAVVHRQRDARGVGAVERDRHLAELGLEIQPMCMAPDPNDAGESLNLP